ncbi:MBL fold metallo-hydrolase [Fulvivirga sp. M361]|uniref:MBL fold metallo-hydrolase n=1 Tax=Fulvivirga sp. M361 TaxID=2594266 RepID=UPI00117AF338|nr:MBL fold metallo-hydrolase [Fulvivirga sp. M361]TRX61242.1 MBL fold metallo-hydrolase [Fulvivirga sp. M361]
MMKVKSFVFNPFMENTYVLYDDTKEAIIIDPGCYEGYEKEQLNDFIKTEGLSVVKLLNTHCHIDHVLGNDFVKKTYGVKLGIHATEEATLKSVRVYAPSYGFQHYEEAEADEFIKEGEDITFGNTRLGVLFVPGHAPGHVAFYNGDDKIMIGGDVLFDGSIGRTDLPGGDFNTLIKSIHEKIFPLPEEVIIYCGHGDSTTIGKEKKTNPFCALV